MAAMEMAEVEGDADASPFVGSDQNDRIGKRARRCGSREDIRADRGAVPPHIRPCTCGHVSQGLDARFSFGERAANRR